MPAYFTKDFIKFLKDLEKNNNRDWFKANKKRFDEDVKAPFEHFIGVMIDKMQEKDPGIIITPKDAIFRIYRDVRFSKNKTPYKTHFGGSFHRIKPKLRGGYYVHIAPNNESFIATGFWEPNREDLLRIRKEFEIDDAEIRTIINDPTFKSIWGEFQGDEVKTAPKGFSKEHKAIDLIRKKQFIFTKKYTDKEVTSGDFMNKVDEDFKAIRPFFNYMSEVLTTDLNGVSLLD